jgi:hypothetical protein
MGAKWKGGGEAPAARLVPFPGEVAAHFFRKSQLCKFFSGANCSAARRGVFKVTGVTCTAISGRSAVGCMPHRRVHKKDQWKTAEWPMHRPKIGATLFLLEMKMARANLGAMSVEALFKLRDEIGKVLNRRAVQLQSQLSRLGGEIGNRSGRSSLKGTKVPVKYRDLVTPGPDEERSPFGCERSSKPVPSSKILPFRTQRLAAVLLRGKQRGADARSDKTYWAAPPCQRAQPAVNFAEV